MSNNTLIIIGNGMASNRVLEELGSEHPFDSIQVLSDESIAHYNRIMLSPLLAGETTLEAITAHDSQWYEERRIQVHLQKSASAIDTAAKQVICADGERLSYQALIIATGSRSWIPALPGSNARNVIGFRTMRDVDTLFDNIPAIRHATVIGAGLLGVEAAVGLRAHGIDVTLVHRNPVLMNRQLDATAASLLQMELEQRGIDVKAGFNPDQLQTDSSAQTVQTVTISNARQKLKIDTGLVIFATGITPNKEIAESAGIACAQGILVDEHMRTSAPQVFALGECCEFNGNTYGLVAPIWDQARVLASLIQHPSDIQSGVRLSEPYQERQHLTKLKVSGVDIHSIGRYEAEEDDDVLELLDRQAGIYRKIILRNDRIAGALCVGDVNDSQWYYELMDSSEAVTDIRSNLIFGRITLTG
ncbi:NAD(P)/FAD-dependent oxidoreductase [Thalassolituus marinus]|uniref:NAD(P)/FAD-dependent oxidoreductase n=1 Tax=Thalassolituus marinus TaxID=671053 RepID=A0ABS7ZMK7_9GAMM|nr:FAD-dependent oxidoreductase [Thalassolituus marinus]MCA6062951.1 NAD(P)/FAD-dependent oxidoreductase [Thalassolituus marinus]